MTPKSCLSLKKRMAAMMSYISETGRSFHYNVILKDFKMFYSVPNAGTRY